MIRRSTEDVQLNVASMLDMAFQLLTFFILTFRPLPLEPAVLVQLPRPVAAFRSDPTVKPGEKEGDVRGIKSLVISVYSESGGIDAMQIGDTRLASLAGLRRKLETIFASRDNPFEQIILNVSDVLRYGETMRVADVCFQQQLRDGKPVGKISFTTMGRVARG
jgi:biopolymer transport protein ExbD